MKNTIAFFDRIRDEILSLLYDSRDYLAEITKIGKDKAIDDRDLLNSLEAMRLVARLTQIMAWYLTQRAVYCGELTYDESMRPDRRLHGHEFCLRESGAKDPFVPKKLRVLLERSHALYERIARLDQFGADRIAELSAQNAVIGRGYRSISG